MKAPRVPDIDDYCSPRAGGWSQIPGTRIQLMPAPLPMQPTEYVRRSWAGRPYGQTAALEVASVHDGRNLAVRIVWENSAAESAVFPDALAIALPVRDVAPLIRKRHTEHRLVIARGEWHGARSRDGSRAFDE